MRMSRAIILAVALPAALAARAGAGSTDSVSAAIAKDPVLKQLGITALAAEDKGWSATMRGGRRVFLFEGEGKTGKVLNAAVTLSSESLREFSGPGVTAFTGMTLAAGALIDSQDDNRAAFEDMPAALRDALEGLSSVRPAAALGRGGNVLARVDLARSDSRGLLFVRDALGVAGEMALRGGIGREALLKSAGVGAGVLDAELKLSADRLEPKGLSRLGRARGLEVDIRLAGGKDDLSATLDFGFELGGEVFEVPLRLERYEPAVRSGGVYVSLVGGFPRVPRLLSEVSGLDVEAVLGTVFATASGGRMDLEGGLAVEGRLRGRNVEFFVRPQDFEGAGSGWVAVFRDAGIPLGALPEMGDIPSAEEVPLLDVARKYAPDKAPGLPRLCSTRSPCVPEVLKMMQAFREAGPLPAGFKPAVYGGVCHHQSRVFSGRRKLPAAVLLDRTEGVPVMGAAFSVFAQQDPYRELDLAAARERLRGRIPVFLYPQYAAADANQGGRPYWPLWLRLSRDGKTLHLVGMRDAEHKFACELKRR